MPNDSLKRFICYSLQDLPSVVDYILSFTKNNLFFVLRGEMGTGKTTLIKEICVALGVLGLVTSPTFSLINEYLTSSSKIVYHFDFYRLNTIEEAYDIGYEDYFFSNNLCFIEWPEKIEELLPKNYVEVLIRIEIIDGKEVRMFDIKKIQT